MTATNLKQALADLHADAMVRQAETIRDWPAGEERTKQAEVHVRAALLDQIHGHIAEDVLCRVYSVLSFVMPDDAATDGKRPPLPELEREAEWEAAYHEQLARQECPECGDGDCRVTP